MTDPVDIRQQTLNKLISHTESKVELLITQAINTALGHCDWKPDDILPRMKCEAMHTGMQTFLLDGEPILELYPVEFDRSPNGLVITSRQPYAFLGKASLQNIKRSSR